MIRETVTFRSTFGVRLSVANTYKMTVVHKVSGGDRYFQQGGQDSKIKINAVAAPSGISSMAFALV